MRSSRERGVSMGELIELTCKNCGGSLDPVTLKCEYCGTRYAKKEEKKVATVAAQVNVSEEMIHRAPAEVLALTGSLSANEMRAMFGLRPLVEPDFRF